MVLKWYENVCGMRMWVCVCVYVCVCVCAYVCVCMRVCVCVCVDGMNLSMHYVGISMYQFILYYASAIHKHMHPQTI